MRAVGSGSGGDNPPADKPGAWKEGAIMARTAALPALKAESGLSHYLDEIRRVPMLVPQEENVLASRWRGARRPRGRAQARHQPSPARRQDRNRLSRVWPADIRGHLGRQCRPDAGGQAL